MTTTSYQWVIGLLAMLVIAVAVWGFSPVLSHMRSPSRCSDFRTRAEAQTAYSNGAHWLDADSDGRPCEALP